jgi:hypothetical protein
MSNEMYRLSEGLDPSSEQRGDLAECWKEDGFDRAEISPEAQEVDRGDEVLCGERIDVARPPAGRAAQSMDENNR